jgi:hypothetical protein
MIQLHNQYNQTNAEVQDKHDTYCAVEWMQDKHSFVIALKVTKYEHLGL